MTKQEFEARTKVFLTDELFWEAHKEYTDSALDKDAFCKWWVKNRQFEYTRYMVLSLTTQLAGTQHLRELEKESYQRLFNMKEKLQMQVREKNIRIKALEAEIALQTINA